MPRDAAGPLPRAESLVQRAAALETDHGDASPEQVLWLVLRRKVAGRAALLSSFGADSVVLLHMVSAIDPATPVIFLDTGKHFAETLAYRDRVVRAFGLTDVRSIGPRDARLAAADPRGVLHATDPDRCCHIRKVEPLARELHAFDAWITGRRQGQTPARAGLSAFDCDGRHLKINPLAKWTPAQVRDYMRRHDLPAHPLLAQGYLSIGCAPCTSSVPAGSALRSGRWQNTGKTECGIHVVQSKVVRMSGAPDPDGPIWKNGAFRRDVWLRGPEAGDLADVPIIVSKVRWLAERDKPGSRKAPIGLHLEGGETIDDIADDLSRFGVITVSFPKFSDGRAFSTARLLRERYSFKGELRAVGNVLSDQIPFMRRVGFDAFAVSHGPTRNALRAGRVPEVHLHYQPATDQEAPAGTRPWLRKSSASA